MLRRLARRAFQSRGVCRPNAASAKSALRCSTRLAGWSGLGKGAVKCSGRAAISGQVVTSQANFVRVLVEPNQVLDCYAAERTNSDSEDCNSEGDEQAKRNRDAALSAVSNGRVELLCVVRALLKKLEKSVLVGDFVTVSEIDWTQRSAVVTEVHPRKSEIREPPLANCNHILLIFALVQPQLDEASLVRFLVTAESSGLPISLALNKADLVESEVLWSWKKRLAEWGYKAFGLSLVTGAGIDDLASSLQDKFTLVAGPSGVGKSSLINALKCAQPATTSETIERHAQQIDERSTLFPSWQGIVAEANLDQFCSEDQGLHNTETARQAVSHVSRRNGRGRHTTRNVTLLQLPGAGLLADTPGFSYPSIEGLRPEKLQKYFPEIRRALAEAEKPCAFANCTHTVEPGCAVGSTWDRYDMYCTLLEEVREASKAARQRGKREERVRLKSRAGGGYAIEARLNTKKHRRQSRRKTRQDDINEAMQIIRDNDDISYNL